MAHFKKRRPNRKKYWTDWWFKDGREWVGHETWRKWKLRYITTKDPDE